MMKSILALLLVCQVASSFVTTPQAATTRKQSTSLQASVSEFSDVLTSSSNVLSLLKQTDPELAKTQFYFFFFAGSGAGGIGLAQIPKITQELQLIRDLSQDGPTEGGDALKTSPVVSLFYPKPISQKDVRKVITNLPTSAKIVANGKSDSYFASKGYVVQDDFLQSLKACNPLASYAAFQAISKGNGKCVPPDDVDEKRLLYKGDAQLEQFATDLQRSVLFKLSSYATLAFLLFIVFDLIIETGIQAFL